MLFRSDSPRLALLRTNYGDGKGDNPAIPWVKVHMLPDYAYFNHAVHLHAGVGCASCHGRVDQMEVVRQVQPLSMGWCLDCHRNPAPNIRPKDQVTNLGWKDDPEHPIRIKLSAEWRT